MGATKAIALLCLAIGFSGGMMAGGVNARKTAADQKAEYAREMFAVQVQASIVAKTAAKLKHMADQLAPRKDGSKDRTALLPVSPIDAQGSLHASSCIDDDLVRDFQHA